LRGKVGGPPDWLANDAKSYFYWEARFDVKWNNNTRMANEACLYNSLDSCYSGYPSQRNDTYNTSSISYGYGTSLPQVLQKPVNTTFTFATDFQETRPDPQFFSGPINFPYMYDPWMPIDSPGYSSNVSLNPAWAWGEFFEGYNFWLHIPWTNTNPSVHQRDTFSPVSFLGASRMYDATGDPEALWLPRQMRRLWVILDPWTHSCCVTNTDCVSGLCKDSICQAPSCDDNVKNGMEWDTDCGGGCKCKDGQNCTTHDNCMSNNCLNIGTNGFKCIPPTCSDQILNGNETGIDCGGACQSCSNGTPCNVDADCLSVHCFVGINHTCAMPTCVDERKNGDEPDVDCGGSSCPRCAADKLCAHSTDCESRVCNKTNPISLGVCSLASCWDNVMNGNETDVDCGGQTCQSCSVGQGCKIESDCSNTSFCQIAPSQSNGACVQIIDTCKDGIKNQMETDIDCGGSFGCPPCLFGMSCDSAYDCNTYGCSNTTKTCAQPSCNDGIKNGDESDVDCGGNCPSCASAHNCNINLDCQSGVCRPFCANGICSSPKCEYASCNDRTRNGNESDIDCGGPCGPCELDKACNAWSDCASGYCDNSTCTTPTCFDHAKNGNESDLDCGGVCISCEVGQTCKYDDDCISKQCSVIHTCVAATCSDGVFNGNETDVDCGGAFCPQCSKTKKCLNDTDCTSNVCGLNTCLAPSCSDGVQNGMETDRDCGGTCSKCPDDSDCQSDLDCSSGVCVGSKCLAPSCTDQHQNGNETDDDCGGSCQSCGVNMKCLTGSDCFKMEMNQILIVVVGCVVDAPLYSNVKTGMIVQARYAILLITPAKHLLALMVLVMVTRVEAIAEDLTANLAWTGKAVFWTTIAQVKCVAMESACVEMVLKMEMRVMSIVAANIVAHVQICRIALFGKIA